MRGKRETPGASTIAWLRGVVSVLKRIAGMPDYARFVAHMSECHPEQSVPTEREYYEEFLKGRYGGGASRCC